MKKLLSFSFFIALFIGANLFVRCSGDNDSTSGQERNPELSSFIEKFYGEKVRYGESVKVSGSLVSRSASSRSYTVTEVFVGNETEARGYDVSDTQSRRALFFVDVDRSAYVARIYNYETSRITELTDIHRSPDFIPTHGFDLIGVISGPGYTDPPQNQVNSWHYTYGAPYYYQGQCYKAVFRQYKVLGIAFTSVQPVEDPSSSTGKPLAIPCNQTYEEWLEEHK